MIERWGGGQGQSAPLPVFGKRLPHRLCPLRYSCFLPAQLRTDALWVQSRACSLVLRLCSGGCLVNTVHPDCVLRASEGKARETASSQACRSSEGQPRVSQGTAAGSLGQVGVIPFSLLKFHFSHTSLP